MLKIKYLHRSDGVPKYSMHWDTKKFKRDNTIDLFSELPFHKSIRKKYQWANYDATPLREFIYSKVGQNWDDIYSEILKKIRKNRRYTIDYTINWFVVLHPIYNDFIPKNNRGQILIDRLFVDMDNILVIKTNEQLLIDSKKYLRKKKIQKILENQNKEQKEEETNSAVLCS